VVRALRERGYTFDGYVGTSIGAINAAILAQGDYAAAHAIWTDITMEKVFDIDEQILMHLSEIKSVRDIQPDPVLRARFHKAAMKVLKGRGICTVKIRALISQYVEEPKLRAAGKDFGLVALSILDRKPYRLMLGDIPQGRLIDYLMASASFPGFQHEKIGKNLFVDGAFHDNCPYRMLLQKGYGEVIAVRTNIPGVFHKVKDTNRVKVIAPSQALGNPMMFSPENSAMCMALGYRDGLKFAETDG
jgi:NTE family protein